MSSITTTKPSEEARARSTGNLHDAADMTLHELVDAFQILTKKMDEGIDNKDGREVYTAAAEVARRERAIVNVALRTRFGLTIDGYDRPSANYSEW